MASNRVCAIPRQLWRTGRLGWSGGWSVTKFRLFVSSPQAEFRRERKAIAQYVRNDSLLQDHFEVFLFEEHHAADESPRTVFLHKVDDCAVYIGLFGKTYGRIRRGVSATEEEFDRATQKQKERLIFVRKGENDDRRPEMRRLIERAENDLVRVSFEGIASLRAALYDALVAFLKKKRVIQVQEFDRRICVDAAWSDLDRKAVRAFLQSARATRPLSVDEDTGVKEILTHLDLVEDGRPINAAVVLFGAAPKRFFPSAEVKCVHYRGSQATTPILSKDRIGGPLLTVIEATTEFVMQRLDFRIGDRKESTQAAHEYEIPRNVIVEAIVNAVVHREYDSVSSVHLMLFDDRLEIHNPGRLPGSLIVEDLWKEHRSVPRNSSIVGTLRRTRYMEEIGRGTLKMAEECHSAGLPKPEFINASGFVVKISRRRAGNMRFVREKFENIASRATPWPEAMETTVQRMRQAAGSASGLLPR